MDELHRLLRLGGAPGAGVGLWGTACRIQWERVTQAATAVLRYTRGGGGAVDIGEAHDRLGFESHFLLIALHLTRVYADQIARITDDGRVRDAIAAFDLIAPDAKDIRDYATHMDEYMLGGGRYRTARGIRDDDWLQTSLRSADEGEPRDVAVTVAFGNRSISLGGAAAAAGVLAEAVDTIYAEHVERLHAER